MTENGYIKCFVLVDKDRYNYYVETDKVRKNLEDAAKMIEVLSGAFGPDVYRLFTPKEIMRKMKLVKIPANGNYEYFMSLDEQKQGRYVIEPKNGLYYLYVNGRDRVCGTSKTCICSKSSAAKAIHSIQNMTNGNYLYSLDSYPNLVEVANPMFCNTMISFINSYFTQNQVGANGGLDLILSLNEQSSKGRSKTKIAIIYADMAFSIINRQSQINDKSSQGSIIPCTFRMLKEAGFRER